MFPTVMSSGDVPNPEPGHEENVSWETFLSSHFPPECTKRYCFFSEQMKVICHLVKDKVYSLNKSIFSLPN